MGGIEFTFTPVPVKPKRSRQPNSKWRMFADAFATFRGTLPHRMKVRSNTKRLELIRWLEEQEPELKGAYTSTLLDWSKGHEIQIRCRTELAEAVARKQFGYPDRPGDAPKPITFTSPEKIAEVLSEMLTERAVWEAMGKYRGTGRSNPFGKAAEEKLLREGKLIRRGPIGGSPGTRYIDTMIQNRLPDIRENFASVVRKTFRDSFRKVIK